MPLQVREERKPIWMPLCVCVRELPIASLNHFILSNDALSVAIWGFFPSYRGPRRAWAHTWHSYLLMIQYILTRVSSDHKYLLRRVKGTENVFACAVTILEESVFSNVWMRDCRGTYSLWMKALPALFSGTGSEEYSSYWSLLSDPLAGSKLGRENNTIRLAGQVPAYAYSLVHFR